MMTNDRREREEEKKNWLRFRFLFHYIILMLVVECSILKGTLIEHDRNGERRKVRRSFIISERKKKLSVSSAVYNQSIIHNFN